MKRTHVIALIALSTVACEIESDTNDFEDVSELTADDDSSVFAAKDEIAQTLAESQAYDHAFADRDFLAGVEDVWVDRVFFDEIGEAHVRMSQDIDGVRVIGGESIIHLDSAGNVRAVTDSFVRNLRVATKATVSAQDAAAIAMRETGGAGRTTVAEAPELVIIPEDDGAILAYQVRLQQFEPGMLPAIPVVFVDARSGELIEQYNDLQDVSLSDSDKRAYTMNNGTNYNTAAIADSSDSVANQAYNNTGTTLAFFSATLGRDSFNGGGAVVNNYVHYSSNYVNAYWDGSRLTYGDGDNVNSGPLVTLDIVAHEFGHGVTDYTANLVYANESGALNEATSDIFSAAVEAYAGGSATDKWHIGEDCWLAGPYLRNMSDPASTGSDMDYYPTRYTGSQDNGGVHWNSGIANLFFYLLSDGGTHPRGKTSVNVTGIGTTNAVKIWYRALTVYMTSGTTFAEARTATTNAATDLFGAGSAQVASVKAAWDAVGVTAPVEYAVFQTNSGLSGGAGTNAYFGPYDASTVSAIKFAMSGGSGDADLYVKYGSQPTTSSYDCRPYLSGNTETCEFNPAQGGNYYVMIQGYSAYSGVTLTVSTAGGQPPQPDPEVCDDGIDNDQDGATDCNDSDCTNDVACQPQPEPEVCNDGVDNDLDGATDCNDSDCSGDAACQGGGDWVDIINNNFEGGPGTFIDGGSDAQWLSTSYAYSGSYALELRDNSGVASSMYTSGFNLAGYSQVEIEFIFVMNGMETNEDFFVELWDGGAWQVVANYARAGSIANNTYYQATVPVSAGDVNFSGQAKLRLRADASANSDWVYIDDVVLRAK